MSIKKIKQTPEHIAKRVAARWANNTYIGQNLGHPGTNFKTNSGSFKKGLTPWNKGIKKDIPIETISKMYFDDMMSTYDIGIKLNVHQKTIYNRLKDNGFILRKKDKHTLISKDKIRSKAKEQYTKYSEEDKQRVRDRLLKYSGINKGITQPAWNKGISVPLERKIKQSHKMKQYYIDHPETKELIKASRAKQVFPLKDSAIEVKIQTYLRELGYDFFTHQHMNIEHSYQCDIFIPALNMVIECDGIYWHKYPTGRDIDHIRTKELKEKGFKVLRLWEIDIKKLSKDELRVMLK